MLNESGNIDLLLNRLFELDLSPDTFEVIFVNDGSTDGTPDKIRSWRDQANICLIERQGKPCLIEMNDHDEGLQFSRLSCMVTRL